MSPEKVSQFLQTSTLKSDNDNSFNRFPWDYVGKRIDGLHLKQNCSVPKICTDLNPQYDMKYEPYLLRVDIRPWQIPVDLSKDCLVSGALGRTSSSPDGSG